MAIARPVRNVKPMTEKFLLHFARSDLLLAAEEILRLYRPAAAFTVFSDEECRCWHNRPVAGEILITGDAAGPEEEAPGCLVSLSFLRQGHLIKWPRAQTVDRMPWEDKTGAERRCIRLLLNELLKDFWGEQASPWGILRGVRPTKLVHRLLDAGQPAANIRVLLQKAYAVDQAKADLLAEVALRQRPFLPSRAEARRLVSIYVGIPFCPSRCLYCSFPSFPLQGANRKTAEFSDALRREIAAVQQFFAKHGLTVQTIYIGGGTPTSLPDRDFRQLLLDIGQAFSSDDLREFSVEAGRPDTITPDKLMIMRETGVDRISINPQSMRERTLQAIGRFHRPDQVEQVFWQAREAGFYNINMDLITGLPGETPEDVLYTLECIGQLRPENLTIHTLAVKRGSNLKECGEITFPPASMVRDMLELCAGAARNWGMIPYYLYRQKYMAGNLENVGYALPGKECLYNIQIMEEHQSIVGMGAAAATKVVDPDDWRVTSCYNPKDVATYINDLQGYVARKLSLIQRVFTSKEE